MSSVVKNIAEILPFDAGGRAYTYAVPETLAGKVKVGQLVRVPLGNSTRVGVVSKTELPADVVAEIPPAKLRNILQIIQETPVLTEDLFRLMYWISGYYAAPLNSVLETLLPAAIRQGVRAVVKHSLSLPEKLDAAALEKLRRRAPKQAALYEFLAAQTVPVDRATTLKGLGIAAGTCDALIDAGVICETSANVERVAYEDDLGESEFIAAEAPVLNAEQQAALDEILKKIAAGTFAVHLLHGVTGSGKTEVYIGAIREVLRQGGSAIFLVPEVALTPQTVGRLRRRLADAGTRVVVWHSHLSAGERHDAWLAMARGEARLVVGARSAVFAPLPALKLIIVDEEHEPSYKQSETPLYHGRDVAVYRARLADAFCLPGSATPSLETLWNVRAGKYGVSRLLARIDNRAMPTLRILDMKREVLHSGGQTVLSRPLTDALRQRIERGEQSILFLNRRGFSRSLLCPECGHVAGCPHCSIALTYHRTDETLRCHGCGFVQPAPASCPECRSPKIRWRGTGTQKLEDVLKTVLPHARVMRLDADTMQRKNLFRHVLADFRKGKLDILLGTQMLAKGLDFPNVTLVGIVDADISLHVPDFRAAERTFQLLVQVAGRAGRGDKSGEVFVQTFTPHVAPIQFAKKSDFDGFLDDEMAQRQEHGYPPARRLIRHLFRGRNAEKVAFYAEGWIKFLEEHAPGLVEVRGPAPCPLERLQDHYRWQAWYFTGKVVEAVARIQELRQQFVFDSEIAETLDVDAVDLV